MTLTLNLTVSQLEATREDLRVRCDLALTLTPVSQLEATREELRVRCEVMEKDLRETQAKNEELQRLADETRQLRVSLACVTSSVSRDPCDVRCVTCLLTCFFGVLNMFDAISTIHCSIDT